MITTVYIIIFLVNDAVYFLFLLRVKQYTYSEQIGMTA